MAYGSIGLFRHLIPFVLLPFYTHLLSQEEFGSLDIIIAMVSFISIVFLQFNVGYARYYYRERTPENQLSYITTMFYFFLAGGLIISVFLTPIGYFLGDRILHEMPGGGLSIAIMFLSFLPQVIIEFVIINMRLSRKKITFAIVCIADSVLRGSLSLVFIGPLNMGLPGYTLGLLLANIVMCVVVLVFTPRLYSGRFCISQIKEITYFTFPMLPSVLLNYANQYGGRFIMLAFLSLDEIAIYALAMKIARMMKLCVQAFRQAWQPVAMEQIYKMDNSVFYAKVFDAYVFVTVILFLAVSFLAKPLINLLAPDNYSKAAILVPYLVAGVLISASSVIVDIGNQIAERTKWISIASGVGSAVNLGIALFFARIYGSLAVAAGFMLSSATTVFVLYIASMYNYRIPYKWQSIATIALGIPCYVLLVFH